MASDDQQFLDLLASIPQDVAHYSGRVADYIEKHANLVASEIRDAMEQSSWLPNSLKPVQSQARRFTARAQQPPQTLWERSVTFVNTNRTVIAITIAFVGTTIYLGHRRRKEHARKRRAKKLSNGAKKEIVILACSTLHDPLTKSLAIDLERRGYVVYVTVSSTEEDSLVQKEAKADLRPLWIDLTSTVPNPLTDTHPNLEPIRDLLTKSSSVSSPKSSQNVRGNQGSSLSDMTLAGIVVFPGCTGYPTGTLAQLPPSDMVDSINTRLLAPVLTVQQFLPMLQRHSSDPMTPSSIVLAYPAIPASLSPPTQSPETITAAALAALASSLRRELRASEANVTVSELKLGNFDLGSVASKLPAHPSIYSRQHYQNPSSQNTSTSSSQLTLMQSAWHSSHHAALARSTFHQSPLIKGSSAREFHNAVFDALAPPQVFKPFGTFEWRSQKKNRIQFVGQGARLYDFVGRWVPDGLVGLMMGYRLKERSKSVLQRDPISSFETGHADTSSNSSSQQLPSWGSGSGSGVNESTVWEKV